MHRLISFSWVLFFVLFSSSLWAEDYIIVIDKYMVRPDSDWLLTLSDDAANIIHQEKIYYHTSLGPYKFALSDLPADGIHLTLSKIAQGQFERTKPTEMHLFFYNIPNEFFVKNSPDNIKGFAPPIEKRKQINNDAFTIAWKETSHLQIGNLPLNTLLKSKFTLQYADRIAAWSIYGMVDQEKIDLAIPKVGLTKNAVFDLINPSNSQPNALRIAVNHILVSEREFVRKHPYELGTAWFLKTKSVEESKWAAWKWEF